MERLVGPTIVFHPNSSLFTCEIAPYIIQAILGLVLTTMPFVLPQSPRWLLVHGHREKAILELKRLDFSAVEAEKDLLGPAAEQRMAVRQPGAVEGLTMLFRKPYRRPALLALYVLGVIQLSGIDGEKLVHNPCFAISC